MMIPESTFANLELIFEHRMYFPLCFLLIALSQIKPKYISLIALLSIICIPCNIERQKAWKDNATLWEDAARKSPLCARTQYNYACGLVNRGELERAISVLKLVPRLPAWRANEPHKLAKALLDDSGYDDCKDKSMYVALRTKKIRYIPLQLHDLQAKKFKPETLTTFNPDSLVTISTSK